MVHFDNTVSNRYPMGSLHWDYKWGILINNSSFSLSLSVSLCLSMSLSLCLSLSLSVSLCLSLSVSLCLSLCLSMSLSIALCLSYIGILAIKNISIHRSMSIHRYIGCLLEIENQIFKKCNCLIGRKNRSDTNIYNCCFKLGNQLSCTVTHWDKM